jgi:formate dehydrogenase subunit gamma
MTLFQLASIVGLGGTVALAAVHYLVFQPRLDPPAAAPRDLKRYSRWERLVHAVTMVGFLVLLVTSFVPALLGRPLRDFGYLLMLHTSASSLFFVGLLAMVLVWAEDCRFKKHDLVWLRQCRCCVSGGEGPADRFDLLQKLYFWLAAVLGLALLVSTMLAMVDLFGTAGQEWLYEIHRWTALALAMATIVHAYRTTLAKPGTWRALLSGTVSAAWAKRYHPLWYERMNRKPETGERKGTRHGAPGTPF